MELGRGTPIYTSTVIELLAQVATRALRNAAQQTSGLCVAVLALIPALVTPEAMAQQPARPVASTTTAVPAARQADNVAVITIEGPIDAVTAWSVQRRMEIAEKSGADTIVFDLNTPGGSVGAVLEICTRIKRSSIRTIAWINPEAYSGGAYIALACKEIIVADYASFGDAAPIFAPGGVLIQMSATERSKLTAPLLAEVVDSARRNGYDEKLVQTFVTLGTELWLVQNGDTGERVFIDRDEYRTLFGEDPPAGAPHLVSSGGPASVAPPAPPIPGPSVPPPAATQPVPKPAPSESEAGAFEIPQDLRSQRPVLAPADAGKWHVLQFVTDGKGLMVLKTEDMKAYGLASATIRNDQELQTFLGAKYIRRLDASWSEGLVAFLTNIYIRGILIVIFLISLFIEMTHPGLIAPGTVAAIALITLLAPPLLINMATWWEVAAIAVGLLLIALEVFIMPGVAVPGVLGVILLFGGLLGTFIPKGSDGALFPNTPEARNDLLYGVTTIVLSVSTAAVGMYYIAKHFGSLPILGRLVLKAPGLADDDGGGLLSAMDPAPGGPLRAGAVGRAMTPLRPAGRIELGDRIIDVVADVGYIPAGSSVRVTSVSEFRVGVELAASPPPPPPPPPPAGPGSAGASA
jgi:membrane-bound ClpP family serine protease